MELNDESEPGAPSPDDKTPAKPKPAPKKSKPVDEAEAEAEVEAEVEADVAEYQTEVESEVEHDKLRAETEALARDYEPSYEPVGPRDEQGQSLLRRLSPYLTVAGLLLIARIVFYSLRRRRR